MDQLAANTGLTAKTPSYEKTFRHEFHELTRIMRNISAALTKEQFYESAQLVAIGKAPVKDVTRRNGWRNLKVGERLQVCEKCQGLKKGGKPVKICIIEVVSVRRERLFRLTQDKTYGMEELRREGLYGVNVSCRNGTLLFHPMKSPLEFCIFFAATHKGCTRKTFITRIEFKYIV